MTVPILHVDSTVRPESRTAALARWLLGRMGGPVETVRLAEGAASTFPGRMSTPFSPASKKNGLPKPFMDETLIIRNYPRQ